MKYFASLCAVCLLLASCGDKEETDGKSESSNKDQVDQTSDSLTSNPQDTNTVEDEPISEVEFGTYFEDWMVIESRAALIKEFGAENVTLDSTWEYEGTELKLSSKVFPDTEREVRYVWSDASMTKYEMLEAKLTRYDDEKEGVVWNREMSTLVGVRTKMSLKELEALNEAPISFAGFGWDNGGVITNFNEGKLENTPFSMTLAPMNYLDDQHPPVNDKFVGDIIFSTDKNPEVMDENIVVYSFYYMKD